MKELRRTVRFVNAEKWPICGQATTGEKVLLGWKKWRGKKITVVGRAVRPDFHFTCGSRRVWFLSDETVQKIIPGSLFTHRYCVCEHQITWPRKGRKP